MIAWRPAAAAMDQERFEVRPLIVGHQSANQGCPPQRAALNQFAILASIGLSTRPSVGGVTPRDWLHFIVSLLCHDIGYVRGICRGDGDGEYVANLAGDKVTVTEGATDAAMTPFHIARSKLFVRDRFGKALIHLDTAEIEANIEHTRFPVPEEEQHAPTDDFPGLLRAADLIGQLADINYLRKTAALFNEFRETGISSKLKFNSAADLRANYPQFFWQMVQPYIADALRYLRVTQEGQQWVANLYANVFLMEHWGKDSTIRSIGTGAPSR